MAQRNVAEAREAAAGAGRPDEVPTLNEERARLALVALAGDGDTVADLAGVSVELNVVAPAGTVVGCGEDADSPGELAGVGFIPAPMARELAADARWRRWVTAVDDEGEELVAVGRDTYRPSAALADLIRARVARAASPAAPDARRPATSTTPSDIRPGRPARTTSPRCAGGTTG